MKPYRGALAPLALAIAGCATTSGSSADGPMAITASTGRSAAAAIKSGCIVIIRRPDSTSGIDVPFHVAGSMWWASSRTIQCGRPALMRVSIRRGKRFWKKPGRCFSATPSKLTTTLSSGLSRNFRMSWTFGA